MPFTQNAAAPLEEGASSAPPCAPGGGRQLFRLVVCDEAGAALRLATDADLLQLLGGGHPAPVAAPPRPAHHHQQPREPSFQELLAETHKRGGPVCDHCGAT